MSFRNTFIILTLTFFFLVLYLSHARAASKHDSLTCASCHTGNNEHGGVPLPAPDICLQCHPDKKGPGHHPVDVAPSAGMEVPAALPLSGGKIWCSTCHNPHGSLHEALLRVTAADLCTSCHMK